MAYRRKQGISRSSTFQEESIFLPPGDVKQGISRSSTFHHESTFRPPGDPFSSSSSSSSSSLVAQAILASAAHRDRSSQDALSNGYSENEAGGFWGVLARKGKDILEESQVAMATAAKAKLLLRELKTVKADLAFAKQRCSQLEEENKMLREAREKGDHPADDDMIRLQLETLLAEKARLAHENSVYARENLILREIVEYHQLTMQDVVYLDEGFEEVTEVSPIPAVSRMLSASPPLSPKSMKSPSRNSSVTNLAALVHISLQHNEESPRTSTSSKGKDLSRMM
ncbi:hypothetical protein RND71_003709 [Anisodus tanguticus]|uniref:Uncharacterized protein n=1 Tax=Anisodus tanguticus TaxID=243964 RepID=A0AAE1STT3_9SOLA|nr:hypothetical protein RND71_003709 [Anisodus tanguticus]